jgi:hypothetical protein
MTDIFLYLALWLTVPNSLTLSVETKSEWHLALPARGSDWQVQSSLEESMLKTVFQGGGFWVEILRQPTPDRLPLEVVYTSELTALRDTLNGFRAISAAVGEQNGQRWSEIEYEHRSESVMFHAIKRIYCSNFEMISVTAIAPKDEWPQQRETILETLDSFGYKSTS